MTKTTPMLLAAAALALAACTPDFDPASQVDKLRVLAVRADPPEIAPAPAAGPPVAPDRAALTSFVVRADFATEPSRRTTVVYLACVPLPGDRTPSPCVMLASLRDPTAVLADAAKASCAAAPPEGPAPVAFAGLEVCDRSGCGAVQLGGTTLPAPEVRIPPGFSFDALPPGASERILGAEAIALAFALDATPEELAAGAPGACPTASVAQRLSELWATREHVLSTKRVQIRGPEAPDAPNRNPAIDGIAADGAALAPGAPAQLVPGTLQLTPVLPAGAAAEPYTKLDASGAPIEAAVEDWVYSWFSTAGELHDLHTRGDAADEWKVQAGGGHALVAAVVRDLRGGVAWTLREVAVGP
ncbi:MAG TPA: hypothetical protein VIW03_04605 [Anaeromyxobacter sp.]